MNQVAHKANRIALLIGQVSGVILIAVIGLALVVLPYAIATAVVVVTLRWMGVL